MCYLSDSNLQAVSNRLTAIKSLPESILSSIEMLTFSAAGVAFMALSLIKGRQSSHSNKHAWRRLEWSTMILLPPARQIMKIIKPDIRQLNSILGRTKSCDILLYPLAEMATKNSNEGNFWTARACYLGLACAVPFAKSMDLTIGVAAFCLAALSGVLSSCYELEITDEIYSFALPYLASTNGIAYFSAAIGGVFYPDQIKLNSHIQYWNFSLCRAESQEEFSSRFIDLTKLPDDLIQSMEKAMFGALGVAYAVLSLFKRGLSVNTNNSAYVCFDSASDIFLKPFSRLIKITRPQRVLWDKAPSFTGEYLSAALRAAHGSDFIAARINCVVCACVAPVSTVVELIIGLAASLFAVGFAITSNWIPNTLENQVYENTLRCLKAVDGVGLFCEAIISFFNSQMKYNTDQSLQVIFPNPFLN